MAKKKAPQGSTKPKPAEFTCCAAPAAPLATAADDPKRGAAVRQNGSFWTAGEPIRFRFTSPRPQDSADLDAVRAAFAVWREAAGGLDVREAQGANERAQIRIAFDTLDPRNSWSKLGVEASRVKVGRTMNFAEPLSTPDGRLLVLHEVGHALGFRHEHQNPRDGVEWNEARVLSHFGGRGWSSDETYKQVLSKLLIDDFDASWDAKSIMNYAFPARCIRNPKGYSGGLALTAALSQGDKARARRVYQPRTAPRLLLKPVKQQPVDALQGEQCEFVILPEESRNYKIETFGEFDCAFTVHEQDGAIEHFMDEARDGGIDDNANLKLRLMAGRRYVVRLRVLHMEGPTPAAIILT